MEIYGLGIDLVEIWRVRDLIKKFGKRFLTRVYTQAEISYCESHKDPYRHFAARFCAKEAILKAFRVGWTRIPWIEIEIVNDKGGSPRVNLYGGAKRMFSELNGRNVLVSISHTRSVAIAHAMILRD